MAEVERLEVAVEASAKQANTELDKMISRLTKLQAVTSSSVGSISILASGIQSLGNAMQSLSGVKAQDFTKIVSGLNKLGTIDAAGVSAASTSISSLANGLSGLGSISFDSSSIVNIANAISKFGSKTATAATANLPKIQSDLISFISGLNGMGEIKFDISGLSALTKSIASLGGKAATNAAPNIRELATALRDMMTTLAGAPRVSQNVIQLTSALANLANSGARAGTAARTLQGGMAQYSNSAVRATRSTKGFVSQIGMFYARCFLAIRAIKKLAQAVKSSMDYIETVNYFDAAFGQVAENAAGEWKQAGYDSAQAYADSFSQRAKQLTGKMTGFTPDENGNLSSTNMPSLGLDANKLMNYQATFGQMASSMDVASETALQLSNALTMIGADLASVKNLDYDQVWNDMASGMVGMSRTLDKYGVNIRNVNLQEKLRELGIKTNISALNQQDKALLRVIVLLESTKYAWGDMASTIGQPANQMRLLAANITSLARSIGNILLPIIAKILPYINALVIAIQRLFAWIGGLLGIDMKSFGGSIGSSAVDMGDFADSAEDAAGGLGDAANNAKKLNKQLQSWHELNNLSSNDDDSGGGGSGGGGGGLDAGLLDEAFLDALSEYQKAWDEAFAGMENTAVEIADRIVAAFKAGDYFGIGKYISDGLTNALESINWDSIYSVAKDFGKGFAEFLNGLITPDLFSAIGNTIAGYWNTLLYAALSFGENFDWTNLGNSLAAGINRFFATFDFTSLAKAINVFATGLLDTLIAFLDTTDWTLIGNKIGTFLEGLDFIEVGGKVGLAIWKAINAGIKLWTSSFEAAPIETSIITAIALLKFTGLGKIASKAIMSSMAKGLSFSGIGKLLASAFPSSTIITTITTAMAETGASLPAVLGGLILTPIKTFFTATIPSAIAGAITAVASALGISVAAAGALIVAAIAAVVATIVYTVTHWDEIKEFWTVTVPAWWTGTVIPFFEGIPGWFADLWGRVKQFFIEKWEDLIDWFSGVPDKIGLVIDDIAKWFDELPGKIGYALGYALGSITKWALEVAAYLGQKIPETINNIVTWFKEMPGKIYDAIITFLANAASWATQTYNEFKTGIDNIIANVVTWFKEMPEKIYDEIIKIKEKITTWATNAIGFFKTEVPKIVDEVVKLFGQLKERMITVGEDLIKGLWEGIKNLTNWLGTNIGNFCKGVVDGFKEGFDEHSPSKITFGIGDYLTIGLWNGMKDKFKDVLSGIKQFTDDVSSQFQVADLQSQFSVSYDTSNVPSGGSTVFKNVTEMITDGIVSASVDGVEEQNSLLREQNDLLNAILAKTGITSSDIFNSVRSSDKEYVKSAGRSAFAT